MEGSSHETEREYFALTWLEEEDEEDEEDEPLLLASPPAQAPKRSKVAKKVMAAFELPFMFLFLLGVKTKNDEI